MGEDSPKRYWTSWDECATGAGSPGSDGDEFAGPLEGVVGQVSRRGFLKAAGFATAAALTSCTRAPVEKAIPYLNQPEGVVPGRASWYGSTCAGCSAGCGIQAKWRDGRPIKLEGNPDHPVSRGGLCAAGQAAILDLYDSARLKGPLLDGKPASWEDADRAITARLESIRQRGGAVRFVSGTVTSPTVQAGLQRFLARFKDARHVAYDALSCSSILDAHEQTHGVRALPRYRFERAEVIVSLDADFLGTWISPVEFAAGYRAGRTPEATPPRFSYHVQLESRLSLTGTKADRRVRVGPDEYGLLLTHLAARLAGRANVPFAAPGLEESPLPAGVLDELADRLWKARGRSLVVCGRQDVPAQVLVNFLNHLLGNYGATLDLTQPSLQRQGSDADLEVLLRDLEAGKVSALFLYGVNPLCELPGGTDLLAALKRVPLVVGFAERVDESAALAHVVCPDHHFLESWGDAEAVSGVVGLFQPTIQPLGNTRSVLESLAVWTGKPKAAYDILRENWEAAIFPRQRGEPSFQAFWDRSVQNGVAEVAPTRTPVKPFQLTAVSPVVHADRLPAGTLALVLYPKVGILDGRNAHNAWLQELPDPISKVAWDNYACLSPAAAAGQGVGEGDIIRIEAGEGAGKAGSLELPVHLQPGQHDAVVAVALGYGRKVTARFAMVGPQWLLARPGVGEGGLVGKNAAPLLHFQGSTLRYTRMNVRLTKTGGKHPLACTQDHHRITAPRDLPLVGGEPRPVVREITLPVLQAPVTRPAEGRLAAQDLWPPDHPTPVHRWAMAIDLSACTGCSACVIGCQAENNIPVVGKDEVLRHREMHWLRIDRYYAGEDEVDVIHQPMLCQQCDNAPCETVCPVLATVHSQEGLNQQVYNRCVGTRYCANNCPYKTRRFNWFNYARDDRLQDLVLNPDVTVRSRGIMEKCTFCVQRIQAAKIEAKQRGELLRDGSIQPACQQSCPARAIAFGDLNDLKSQIAQWMRSPRRYGVLEELNFRPAVGYLEVVRNRPETKGRGHHG
jgi:molybdopterin-containing oxidoreductase family iron-sulfur binding subunit